MSLRAQLDACRHAFEATTPPSVAAALQDSIAELAQTGLVRHAIKAGEMAPPFRLRRRDGGFVSLSDVLDRGPAVISFFRGAWCPFCNLAMQALARAQTEIEQLGATLAGLSPFLGSEGSSILPVLSDTGCRIAARYRIAFTVRPQFQAAYLALGYPSGAEGRPNSWVLPLPATYVVDRNGRVVLSYVDTDYRTRLEPAEIIVALGHLRAKATANQSF
jgi:peroxiredoxin